MLPDDPVLKGRLFRAARVLLRWNQAHLAARAGLSASTVNALENARHSASTTSAKLVALALEVAGIRFLGVADGLGHGLRYGGSGQHRPAGTVVRFGQPHRPTSLGRATAKAQARLCARYRALSGKGKKLTVTVTALARELAGFVWAIGREVKVAA